MNKGKKPSITEKKLAHVAQVAYEVLAAWEGKPSIHSKPEKWDLLCDTDQGNIIDSVASVLSTLSSTQEERHKEWARRVTLKGWRYKPKFSTAKKHTPWLVEYNKISPQQHDFYHAWACAVKAGIRIVDSFTMINWQASPEEARDAIATSHPAQ